MSSTKVFIKAFLRMFAFVWGVLGLIGFLVWALSTDNAILGALSISIFIAAVIGCVEVAIFEKNS